MVITTKVPLLALIVLDFPFKEIPVFWMVVSVSIVFKLLVSENLDVRGYIAAIFGGILCAVVGTLIAMDVTGVENESALILIAAILALIGDHQLRKIIKQAEDGNSFLAIFKDLKNDKMKETKIIKETKPIENKEDE